jgi:hypothetical protein
MYGFCKKYEITHIFSDLQIFSNNRARIHKTIYELLKVIILRKSDHDI